MFDIHTHILANVDDGAANLDASLALLDAMKKQGITDVLATPHFDANYDNLDDFFVRVSDAYDELKAAISGKDLPSVQLGSEVYYFYGIGRSSGVRSLGLCGSPYILLELPNYTIEDKIINDIVDLNEKIGMIPIIAHIERLACERGFKKLLELIKNGVVYAQVNAHSVIQPPFKKTVHKLIKSGYVSFIATDAHSMELRPPMMDLALREIATAFDSKQKNIFLENSDRLYRELSEKEKIGAGAII